MQIYIDASYKCHAADDETRRAVECGFFDGKCDTFIEGYRYIPEGESWTREDGKIFEGEMVSPWRPYNELNAAQTEYDSVTVSAGDYVAAYEEGVQSA